MDFCLNIMYKEFQPSIRLYAEMIAMRVAIRKLDARNTVFENLTSDRAQEKVSFCCSLIGVVVHLGRHIDQPRNLVGFC